MAAIDPNPNNFPILSYVLSRIPSITPLRQQSPPQTTATDAHDIEQPPPPPAIVDPLIERMPHLKDPKVIAAMAEAVSEISQSRSVLKSLGERPDHEAVDIAKVKLAEIEAELSDQLEEIELSPGPSDESGKQKREAIEKEKTMYKAVIQVDEMHDAYQKLLNDAEERLMKMYDSAAVENEKEVIEEGVDEEVNEEVVDVLRQQTIERVDLSGKKLRILPEAFGRLRGIVSLNLSTNQLQAIPDSISGCENLEELNLSSNSLHSLPDSLGLLLKLKILNVAGNKLSALPDSISNCRSLVELDASFNTLGYLPTAIGFELVNLIKLLVPYNKLRFFPTSIGEMKSLQHLDAHFNELHNVPVTIGQLTNLRTLNLSGNFSDLKELPDTFCDLINLEELDLSNNQIHSLPNRFDKLEKLKKLNLDQNPVVIPPIEVIEDGVEAVRIYMANRWADLVEEEERVRHEVEEVKDSGWLKRSVSKIGVVVSSVSEYLGSPKSPHDPCLDLQL